MRNQSLARLKVLLKVIQVRVDMSLLNLKPPAPNNYILLAVVFQPRSLFPFPAVSEPHATLASWDVSSSVSCEGLTSTLWGEGRELMLVNIFLYRSIREWVERRFRIKLHFNQHL